MSMAAASPKNSLKILELTRVCPFSDSPISAAEFSLPLTFYDIFWLKFHPVERLFFYRLTDSSPSFFNSVVVPKLKRSLALTLLHYLPLAGHINWPSHASEPVLLYAPNDGVSFTVAESAAADFDRLAGHGTKQNLELRSLVPQLKAYGEKIETLTVQITLFPGRGFCIGVTSHHAVLDGKTTTSFMKSWSCICREQVKEEHNFVSLPENLTPFLDRSVIKDPLGLSGLYAKLWMEYTGSGSTDPDKFKPIEFDGMMPDPTEVVRATYVLSNKNIKMLKDRVLPKLDEAKRRRLSTFAVVWGYVVVCAAGARTGEGERMVMFGFAVDYRARLNPPLPESYFGNCVGGLAAFAKAKELTEENGLVLAVDKTIDQIESLDYKLHQDGSVDTLSPNLKYIEGMRSGEPSSRLLVVSVAGSPRFGVYGSDFGWGKPEKVEVVSIDRNAAVSLAETRDEARGGVEVGVALKKDEIDKFASLFAEGLK